MRQRQLRMPYVTPVDHQDPDIPPLKLRQRLRSAKATFMDERGPEAFARFLNFLVTNRNHLTPSSTSARMTATFLQSTLPFPSRGSLGTSPSRHLPRRRPAGRYLGRRRPPSSSPMVNLSNLLSSHLTLHPTSPAYAYTSAPNPNLRRRLVDL